MRTLGRLIAVVGIFAVLVLAVVGAASLLTKESSNSQAGWAPVDGDPNVVVVPPPAAERYDTGRIIGQPEPARIVIRSEGPTATRFPMLGDLVVGVAVLGAGLLIVLGFVLLVRRNKRVSRSLSEAPSDDIALMQEIYRNLSRMEQRIEALETLLLERSSKVTLEKH